MTATRVRPGSRPGARGWLLFRCDAGLLAASGLMHLHLWDIAYRHVPTLHVLFLVQALRRPGRRRAAAVDPQPFAGRARRDRPR